ncbi:MAG: hypothetical protein OXI15_01760 [Chromatiales bacterium]|nr:hypothetical protein [Chromatiales bacterium]
MQSPLTDEEFDNVTRPIETALGLPNRAYTDEAFLDAERERVLGRGWIAVAFSRDVPVPGDLFPASAAGQPLLVVRDANRSIRVRDPIQLEARRGELPGELPSARGASGAQRVLAP